MVRSGSRNQQDQGVTMSPPVISSTWSTPLQGHQPPQRLPRARISGLRTSDVWAIGGVIVLVTLVLWLRGGGAQQFSMGTVGVLQAVGQLSGFAAALAALAAIVLTARPAWLERSYGFDRLLGAHRWFGIVTVFTLVVHAVTDTIAWGLSTRQNVIASLVDLMANEAWMLAAVVSAVLFFAIGLTSWRRLRQRMSYETWYFVHTLGYLAVLLGFGHQLTLGTDIAGNAVATWWWAGLAIVATVVVVWSRVGVFVAALRRPLFVNAISKEAERTYAMHLSGPGLTRIAASSGQFFHVRPLAKGLWWQSHPFSVSAAPTTAGLRFTIKELGDDTPSLVRIRPGTRVLLEGPYGVFTAEQALGHKVILVAGGVGIAPIRALLEDLRPEQEPIVVVRVHHERDLAHRVELERLVASRAGRLIVLAGPRASLTPPNPFAAEHWRALVPDLAQRHAFVCGPADLESAVHRGLRKAGMASDRIHHESFGG